MDDFNVSFLHESRNEWCAQLLNILTPYIVSGFKLIFSDAVQLCRTNNEPDKYLKTFQNLLARIPKWNENVLEKEKNKIITQSGCAYLEELIACVHIIQLKLLTAIRVGSKQKKVDIHIPKLDGFLHKIYINAARKIYKNVYLFELNISPLESQKYTRGLELIVQECIMSTIRDSIPIENILRAYMDETSEEDVTEEIKEEIIPADEPTNTTQETTVVSESSTSAPDISDNIEQQTDVQLGSGLESEKTETLDETAAASIVASPLVPEQAPPLLKFNDVDSVLNSNNTNGSVSAPKTIERLEEISAIRNAQRKSEEENEQDDGSENLVLGGDVDVDLSLDMKSLPLGELDGQTVSMEVKLDDMNVVM